MPGMTKLQAVNRLLAVIDEGEVSAVDSTGSWPTLSYGDSEAGRAERILDDVTRETLAMGWPGNTDKNKTYTADGSGVVSLSADRVLSVRGSGNFQSRMFTIRGDELYDMVSNTTAVTTADGDVTLDVVRDFEFDDLPEDLKNVCVLYAEQRAMDLLKPNQMRHDFWDAHIIRAEVRAGRLQSQDEWNTRPVLPQAAQNQQ